MIEAHNIGYNIGGKALLSNCSLSIAPGRLHLILGANGAGKSTLVRLLSGQITPKTGSISYAGRLLSTYSLGELATLRAVLSQNIELSFPLSVWEVVMMGRYPHFSGQPGTKDKQACKAAMAFFNIEEFATRDYITLSGGEKQRVQFARVLAQLWYPVPGKFRYLFLDEPLTFLDAHFQHQFLKQIKLLLQAGDLVVAGVVHDLNLASSYADDLTLLHDGAILASGAPGDVLTVANITAAYKSIPEIIVLRDKNYILF